MPKLTILPDGAKMASPGRNASPPKRGAISGWSPASARRNRDFLMSVVSDELDGLPIAFTLTIRDMPASHDDWERIRRAFCDRMRRMGLIRMHWLTEFQRRGAPHLHGVAFFDRKSSASLVSLVVESWLDLTSHLRSAAHGQHVDSLRSTLAWKRYLAKHGSRSVQHYQRGAIPPGWTKTGRLWGKLGEWSTSDTQLWISKRAFWAIRRLIQRQLAAEARSDLRRADIGSQEARDALRRLKFILGRRKCNTRSLSEVRGFTDWIDPASLLRILQRIDQDDISPWEDRPGLVLPPSPAKSSPHPRIPSPERQAAL